MKALIWRIIIAAIIFTVFWWIFPLFLAVLEVHISVALIQLLKVCSAAVAILYVLFGPVPPYPW
jgi:hypothetical protein